MPSRVHAARLLVLLSIGLSLRLALLYWTSHHNASVIWYADAPAYERMANQAIRTGIMSLSRYPNWRLDAYRPLGYPGFLAAVYSLCGQIPTVAIALQIVLSSLTILLTYLIGKAVWNPRVGLMSAAFMCLDPASIGSCQVLHSETLFTTLLGLAILLIVRVQAAHERETYKMQPSPTVHLAWLLLAGLLVALATHVRAIGLYLIPVLGIVVFCTPCALGHGSKLRPLASMVARQDVRFCTIHARAIRTIAFVLFPSALVGGWLAHNLVRTGQAVFYGIEGVNLLSWRAAGTLAVQQRRPIETTQAELGFEQGWRPFDRYFAQHPGAETLSSAA
ncbi:MAG: phospholipid carrier-dependent glycosyltransferase, partial [candidate division WOR-3 bacterium]